MPTFVQSAMNPLGTWQSDALDQSEQANRNAAMQSAQMANEIAYRNLQARLEQQRMAQQGSQFSQDLAARTGMHDEDLANSRLLQSGSQDFARQQLAQELAARNHEADLRFGPNSLPMMQYQRQVNLENQMAQGLGLLPGGQAAAPTAHGDPVTDAMSHFMPGISQMQQAAPAQRVGAIDPDMLKRAALYSSITHGTPMPDFQSRDLQAQAATDSLHQHELEIAQSRIQQMMENGDVVGAKQLAAQSGAVVPRVDPNAVKAKADVQGALVDLMTKAQRLHDYTVLGGSEDSDERVNDFRNSARTAIAMLVKNGVKPEDALAYVQGQIRPMVGKQGENGLSFPGFRPGADIESQIIDSGAF